MPASTPWCGLPGHEACFSSIDPQLTGVNRWRTMREFFWRVLLLVRPHERLTLTLHGLLLPAGTILIPEGGLCNSD